MTCGSWTRSPPAGQYTLDTLVSMFLGGAGVQPESRMSGLPDDGVPKEQGEVSARGEKREGTGRRDWARGPGEGEGTGRRDRAKGQGDGTTR